LGGKSLLHSGSLSNILSEVYPDYGWLPWQFSRCPATYWDDIKNQRKFLDWASKELKLKEPSDWYNVTVTVIKVRFFQVESQGIE
jgi:hypothetical protein